MAVPAALVVALLFHASAAGRFLQSAFFRMAVHEIGHAVTAWLCGVFAVPFLWKTFLGGGRGFLVPLLVLAAITYLFVRSWNARSWAGMIGAGLLAGVQLVCTLVLSKSTVAALITFGGDGGAMVLGTALMATFYFGRSTQLYTGMLRWGFLVIGSAAFVGTFAQWWSARTNDDVIPFGEIEGVGLSDPSKLVELHGWSVKLLVHRYVTLGCLCLVATAALWVYGMATARRATVR